jgi:thiamine biosynthesis protein ThiS
MRILVNGKQESLPEGATVADLVRRLGLESAPCAAEVNKALVPKREHPTRALAEGDQVELVTLVGGG